MLKETPTYILAADVATAPLHYKWNNTITVQRYDGDDNERLADAIDESSFRAKMALGAVLAEWCVWRFQAHADITDGLLRIEAAWAGVIHPAYSKELKFKLLAEHSNQQVEGALAVSLAVLGRAFRKYSKGDVWLSGHIMPQAQMARYLAPDAAVFDAWLSNTLRRTAQIFPRGPKYDKKSGVYDASGEKPVPQVFFEPSFQYTEAAATAALNAFLQGLDPQANPYLRTPQEMLASGFAGTPYKI